MSEVIIGIDLGTTNSEVAVVRNGQITILPVSEGVFILPSVVGLDGDGSLLVGAEARNQYILHPERTIRSVKRRMGEVTTLSMGDKEYRPQEISAMILRRLKSIAEEALKQEVRKAVITVPAYFSDAQRQATREAGEIAGLEVVRIINEPTAAALTYEKRTKGARKALVYDLGGGTFDASVVNLEGDVVEVLSSHGDNRLGGDDFDHKIVEYVLDRIKETHGLDPASNPVAMARIQRASEVAKIALSSAPYATISEEYLLEREGMPVHLSLEISRSDYEEMISDYIEETMSAVHIALSGARMVPSDLDEVLLVGGASRTPMVSRRLREELCIEPRIEMDPDLCVAMGAAVQGGILAGEKTPTVLIDVTPYTFGTSAISDLDGREAYPYCFIPLIHRNTPIPVSRSEVFYTCAENQKTVEIRVFQGEDRDALNNIEIGSFRIEGLAEAPAGNPIVTTFSLDLNGILHVSSKEKKSGLEHSITIANAFEKADEERLAESRERVGAFFSKGEEESFGVGEEPSPLVTEAQAMIEKAWSLLADANPEDKEDLQTAIENVEAAFDGPEADLISAKDALNDLLYYLES